MWIVAKDRQKMCIAFCFIAASPPIVAGALRSIVFLSLLSTLISQPIYLCIGLPSKVFDLIRSLHCFCRVSAAVYVGRRSWILDLGSSSKMNQQSAVKVTQLWMIAVETAVHYLDSSFVMNDISSIWHLQFLISHPLLAKHDIIQVKILGDT